MAPVRILPSDLINQIAAGEVVERPASVVKELVENSLDAGASKIEIILQNGGRTLVEVRDNGVGMSEADARLALERHATSKISEFDDLLSVRTLGFRGEALPSIASVSRFTLVSSDSHSGQATEIHHDPLTGTEIRPSARDRGTTVRVADLFENVPARRKFLKSSDAEFRAIVTVVTSYSIPSPERSFRLEHNGRTVLDFPSAGDRAERIVQILGDDREIQLSPILLEMGDTVASGFVTRGLRFGSRRHQYFFVNGRLVKDRLLTHAATRAAEAFDFEGHPAIFLFLDLPPQLVDVNVHPAKTEVRFREGGKIHVAVEQGIRMALAGAEEGQSLLQAGGGEAAVGSSDLAVANLHDSPGPLFPPVPQPFVRPAFESTPLFQSGTVVQPPLERNAAPLGALQGRVIGQYRMSYILLDAPDGLRLVDQHVAHERVLYDRYENRIAGGTVESQRLLTPMIHEAGAPEVAILESHLDEMRSVGFEIERFSGNAFAIASVPSPLSRESLPRFFQKVIDASLEERTTHWSRIRHRIVASLACQAAIKVHRPLTGEEMSHLVADLLQSSNPYACPHGRPIVVDIKHVDIEKHFHRR